MDESLRGSVAPAKSGLFFSMSHNGSLTTLQWLATILALVFSIVGAAFLLAFLPWVWVRLRGAMGTARAALASAFALGLTHLGAVGALGGGAASGVADPGPASCALVYGFLANLSLTAPFLLLALLALSQAIPSCGDRGGALAGGLSVVCVVLGLGAGIYPGYVYTRVPCYQLLSAKDVAHFDLLAEYAPSLQIFHLVEFGAFYALPLVAALIGIWLMARKEKGSPERRFLLPISCLVSCAFVLGLGQYGVQLRLVFAPEPLEELLTIGFFFLHFSLILGLCLLYPIALSFLVFRATAAAAADDDEAPTDILV